jgi:hypothetical protein
MELIVIGLGLAAGAGLLGHRMWNRREGAGARNREAAQARDAKAFQAQVHKGFQGGAVR